MKRFTVRAWENIVVPRLMDITVEANDCQEIIDALHKGKLDDLAIDWNEIHVSWEAMRSMKYDKIENIEEADGSGTCDARLPVFADPTEKMLILVLSGKCLAEVLPYSQENISRLDEEKVSYVIFTRADIIKIFSMS